MQESIGHEGSLSKRLASEYRAKADNLRKGFNTDWWNSASNRFYSGILPDRSFAPDFVSECNMYTLLFGIPKDGPKPRPLSIRLRRIAPSSLEPTPICRKCSIDMAETIAPTHSAGDRQR